SLMVLLKFWKPAQEQNNDAATNPEPLVGAQSSPAWKAWLPWILLSVLVFVWGIPTVKHLLNGIFAPNLTVPGLHNRVLRTPPVVPVATSEKAVFVFDLLAATGTSLLLAAILAGLSLGLKPAALVKIYGRTLRSVRASLLTISCMLALGFTTR